MTFTLKGPENTNLGTYEAISCDKYIEKYLSDLVITEQQDFSNELYKKPEKYICPDTGSFKIQGFLYPDWYSLQFELWLNDDTKETLKSGSDKEIAEIENYVNHSQVKFLAITKYFSPEYWNENGTNRFIAA